MPTFSTVALENLLEPNVSRPTKSKDSKPISLFRRQPLKDEKRRERKPQHVYFSPSLYTTPEPTPIPDPPSSFSPSPYVINYKRREPRPRRSGSCSKIVVEEPMMRVSVSEETENSMEGSWALLHKGGNTGKGELTKDVEIGLEQLEIADIAETQKGDGFDVNGGLEDESELLSVSCPSEFYDAPEDFSRDGSLSPRHHYRGRGLQAEVDAVKSDLLLEIEKRKKAEEAIQHMNAQWGRIATQLSRVGLSFPMFNKSRIFLEESNAAEVLWREIEVIRIESAAVGSANARAEAVAAAKSLLKLKNIEIARLRDKLQYYEAVNREMTQRNLENSESSRRLGQRRQIRKKFWTSIGLSLAIGIGYLAYYSHLPPQGTKLADTS